MCGCVDVGVGCVGGWMDVGVGCVGGWMYVGGVGVCGCVWVCVGGLCGCVELCLNLAITNTISEHKTYVQAHKIKQGMIKI